MSADANADKEESSARVYFWLAGVVLFSLVIFYLASIVFFICAYFLQFGITAATTDTIAVFLNKLGREPFYLFEAYNEWWHIFRLAYRYGQLIPASFLPFVPILLFAGLLILSFVKSPYSFRLWYRLNNRFAKMEDVRQMGLLDGNLMDLGDFQGSKLRLNRPLSVFGWGSPGFGKTTTVAIPSILDSDDASVVAVDSKGTLARYTSGYRASLGQVFYFNWNLLDNPEKGEFWPRWNPLSPKNLPPKGPERDKYFVAISKYMLSKEKDNYWEKLSCIAMEGLLQFFVSKTEQAYANDYFLSCLLEKGKLSNEDRDILLSYYAVMPEQYSKPAIEHLNNGSLTIENYLPVGSWDNIPAVWQGREFCFPMFTDCLIQRYYAIMKDDDGYEYGGWKIMLNGFIREAEFFGYHPRAIQVMRHLFYLTRKQRQIIFTMLLEPLSVFRKNSVRERTVSSDLSFGDVRGIRNPQTGKWQVSTIYSIAENRHSSFLTKFFTDMIIGTNLKMSAEEAPFPLLFVLDDFELLPKFDLLNEGLTHGAAARLSFLLLTDNLKNVHDVYGLEGLEEIISNTSCKLMFADNNRHLSDHFNRLAVYGTKSVQIPATDTGAFYKVRQGLADATYYRRIAQVLLKQGKRSQIKKGEHLLLVQGFYHLPVKVSARFFLKDETLKAKATMDTAYLSGEDVLANRNPQDADAPQLTDVLAETGATVRRDEEIDEFLQGKYEEVVENIREPMDKKSALAEDISSRWKNRETDPTGKPVVSSGKNNADEWWMSEESFSIANDVGVNPFEKQ